MTDQEAGLALGERVLRAAGRFFRWLAIAVLIIYAIGVVIEVSRGRFIRALVPLMLALAFGGLLFGPRLYTRAIAKHDRARER